MISSTIYCAEEAGEGPAARANSGALVPFGRSRGGASPLPTARRLELWPSAGRFDDHADGDGDLDIVVSLKDSEPQVLIFEVPASSDNCLLWPTGRGNALRNGWLP